MIKKTLTAIGFMILGGGVAVAASGDFKIPFSQEPEDITALEASTIAACFKAVDAWDGANSAITRCCAGVESDSPTGYRAQCDGTQDVAPGSVSFPITIHGVVP